MADNSTASISTLNTFLTVWGLVTPLVVGIVSAWWNRKKNIEERDYQRSLFIQDQKKEREREMIKNQLHIRNQRLLETKGAILNYLRISHENFHSNIDFLSCHSNNQDEKIKLLDIHSKKIQEMNNSYNELYLLVPTADVAKSSTMLMNHLSNNKNITLDKEGLVAIATAYAKLREELLIAARKYTQEEEQNIINIAQSM